MLRDRIKKELVESMKTKDSSKTSCLRMLWADIHNLSIQKKGNLQEEDIIKVIQKQIRQHKDSIEQFKKAERTDLVDKEEKELRILESFMPKPLSEDELKMIVEDVIKRVNASTKKDMGKVMKEVIAKVKGRADGKAINRMVSSMLT